MKKALLVYLISFIQIGSLLAQQKDVLPDVRLYLASLNTGGIEQVRLDTSITSSQIVHPLFRKFPAWNYLGNTGLPATPLKYYGLPASNTPYFLNPFLHYNNPTDQLEFYNTKKPFSMIAYNQEITGDKQKVSQTIDFIYTRNVGPDINISGIFDYVSHTGQYKNQATIVSTMKLNVSVDKERYKLFTSLERIQFKLGENGGVVNDDDVLDRDPGLSFNIPVRYNKATSQTGLTRLKGLQYFDFSGAPVNDTLDSLSNGQKKRPFVPVVIHRYNFVSSRRLYKDVLESLDYYPDAFISDTETNDSIQHISLMNSFGLNFSGFINDSIEWRLEGGIHHEVTHFYSFDQSSWNQSIAVYGIGNADVYDIGLVARGRLMFAGYQAGDYLLEVKASYNRVKKGKGPGLTFKSQAESPDLFVLSYMGNHFKWENDLKRQREQSIGFNWDLPKLKLKFHAQAGLISNWIYFNYDALPDQRQTVASFGSASVSKEFVAGPFRSVNTVHINYSPAEEIPLPLAVASTSTFMHHDFHFRKTNGLLQLEYGFDVRYASEYQGYAYMPATGVFYLQKERKLGNYPVVDLFLIARVKRTRFFVKWEHANSGLTGGDIFPVLHYPLKQRYLKYGVFWHFHD